jgi:hypothetical protein
MACEYLTGEGVLFSVWGKPSIEDMEKGLELARLMYANAGGPIVYVTRVPVHAPPPDAEVRRFLHANMPKVASLCASYHVVLEGEGFASAMKRAVLLGMFQIVGRRNTFFVHASVDGALSQIDPSKLQAVRALLRRAEMSGLLSSDPPLPNAKRK